MPQEPRRRRRFHVGSEPQATGLPQNDALTSMPLEIADVPMREDRGTHHRFTVSPEELGVIGAELTKRLTFAAEEYLTELVEGQVRDAFREELSGMLRLDD